MNTGTKTGGRILALLAAGAFAVWAHKKNNSVSGIGAARKYYVYAGYYENLISSEPMPRPYVLRKTFRSIDRAIDYAESFGDHVTYCDNVKYDLPDFMREALDEANEFFTYGTGKINPNRKGTRVIFRVFKSGYDKGEVIAIFPDESWSGGYDYASYMHNGQHGAADYNITNPAYTRPATPQEYAPLLRELKQIGYDDLIIAHKV